MSKALHSHQPRHHEKWHNSFGATSYKSKGFPGGSVGKESACNVGDAGDPASIPGLGRFPWWRAWQLTPVFLPIESLGQRNLAGYSKWDSKESDMTEITEHTAPTSPEENSLALGKVRLFLSSKV